MQHHAFMPATRAVTATVMDLLSAAVRMWWHSHEEKRRRRETVRALQGLDDRLLKDIGLSRSEIESIVATRGGDRRHRYNDGAARGQARP
jgi:uncharacterized protein YjiS (DUF1127 family)